MRQRFGIAQALLGRSKLIIVDEPTAWLDPQERVRFHNLLSDIGEEKTVILSTHIVSDVAEPVRSMAIINKATCCCGGETQSCPRRQRPSLGPASSTQRDLPTFQQRHAVISVAAAVRPHADPRLQRPTTRATVSRRLHRRPGGVYFAPSPAATAPRSTATKGRHVRDCLFERAPAAQAAVDWVYFIGFLALSPAVDWPRPAACSKAPTSPSASLLDRFAPAR